MKLRYKFGDLWCNLFKEKNNIALRCFPGRGGLAFAPFAALCENECPDFREGSIQDLLQSSIDIARGHGRERMERGMRTGADSAS